LAELLNLLPGQQLIPTAAEIEPLQIENKPAIVRRARASPARKSANAIGSRQSICFHNDKIDMRKGKHDEAVD